MKLCDITQNDIQKVISSLSSQNSKELSWNYIFYSFLGSEMIIRTTMPQNIIPELYIPSDEEIKLLIDSVKDT